MLSEVVAQLSVSFVSFSCVGEVCASRRHLLSCFVGRGASSLSPPVCSFSIAWQHVVLLSAVAVINQNVLRCFEVVKAVECVVCSASCACRLCSHLQQFAASGCEGKGQWWLTHRPTCVAHCWGRGQVKVAMLCASHVRLCSSCSSQSSNHSHWLFSAVAYCCLGLMCRLACVHAALPLTGEGGACAPGFLSATLHGCAYDAAARVCCWLVSAAVPAAGCASCIWSGCQPFLAQQQPVISGIYHV